LTPPKATIRMPYFYTALAHTNETPGYLGIFAATDILYPRRIYWGAGEGVKPNKVFPVGKVYQVTHPYWQDNQCKDHPEGKPLGYNEWFICPATWENKNASKL